MTQWQPTTPALAQAAGGNKVGLVALITAVAGAVLAIAVVGMPVLVFLSGFVLFVAFVMAIVGLVRKGLAKGTSVVALILSLVFGVVGPVLFAGRFVADVGGAMAGGSTLDTSKAVKVGEKVTNSAGVEFTVKSVDCGSKKVTDKVGMTTKARGQFCLVKTHIKNGSSEEITVSTSDITGYIGTKSYQADSTASDLGGDAVLTNINPGISLNATFALDIPAKKKLDYVQLRPTWSFQDPVVIRVS